MRCFLRFRKSISKRVSVARVLRDESCIRALLANLEGRSRKLQKHKTGYISHCVLQASALSMHGLLFAPNVYLKKKKTSGANYWALWPNSKHLRLTLVLFELVSKPLHTITLYEQRLPSIALKDWMSPASAMPLWAFNSESSQAKT